jgi:RND family efflux transporter MFP subunit/NodT family efflux transporter outer membrane factor (OMF) lipoprotein
VKFWQSEVGVQASWELDFWGRIRRSIQSAEATLLSSLADYDSTLVTLTAEVANNYIGIRTAEERIRIARENADAQEQILKITDARFRFGTATQRDVEQARTSLLNTQASIPPLEAQRRQAQDALSVLLGMPPSDLSDVLVGSSGIPASPPEIIVGIPADLLRRRPDVRSAELQAVAQSAQIGAAKGDLLPIFSLNGSLVFVSTDLGKFKLSDMFKWGSRQIQAGPSVQWNILNYGQITNNVRVQDAAFQELLIAYQNTVLSAQRDVEDNLVAFLRSQDRAELLAQSVTSAKTALDIAVLQYREGITDFTTVLTAQNTVLAQPGEHTRQHLLEPRRDLSCTWRRLGDQGRPGSAASRDQGRDGAAHELGRVARPGDLQSAGLPSTRVHSPAPRLVTSTVRRTALISSWIIMSALAAVLAGCKDTPKPQPPPPPKVTVAQPVQRTVTDYLELTGNTQAIYTVQLVARVAGFLEQVLFQDGQYVKKGQPLFVIQRNTYEDNLRQAEAAISQFKAQLQYAESQYTRYSNLIQHNAATQSDLENWRFQRDQAQANLRSAEAQRDLAKQNLDYTLVTAPFDGRMDRRQVDPGNLVGSGTSTVLASINQIDPIYVYFNISDYDLARLRKRAGGIPGPSDSRRLPIQVGLPGEDGYPHQGHLDFAAISLTSTTGTLLMRGILPNASGGILPGLFARVRVPLEQRPSVLVPEVAIGHDQQGAYVFVVNEKNAVERRGVKTGPAVDALRAVDDGLTGKEWVVVNGLLKAAPGRQVTPEREGDTRSAKPAQ